MWLNDLYHTLDPIAIAIGPIVIRWYGLAYLAGFICAGVTIYRTARRWSLDLTGDEVVNYMTGIALGVIVGGRLGYCLIYGKGYYLAHPLEIVMVNEGGMSFHGGLVGAALGSWLSSKSMGLSFASMADLTTIGAPFGLLFGRLANFVNGELWGKETTLPWGVMFSNTGGGDVYRHPSQLYEALLEGVVMLCILHLLSRKKPPRPQGFFLGCFLFLYGCFRFLVEFVRVPDAQMGYLAGGWLTTGQVLSVPLVLLGIAVVVMSLRWQKPQQTHIDTMPES